MHRAAQETEMESQLHGISLSYFLLLHMNRQLSLNKKFKESKESRIHKMAYPHFSKSK